MAYELSERLPPPAARCGTLKQVQSHDDLLSVRPLNELRWAGPQEVNGAAERGSTGVAATAAAAAATGGCTGSRSDASGA
ncbi:hypothetical protein PLESTM_001379800 [Pleodorina starrii]|nr:hypothetical protein PLESTM_001379800 [Pleodorina starrii]